MAFPRRVLQPVSASDSRVLSGRYHYTIRCTPAHHGPDGRETDTARAHQERGAREQKMCRLRQPKSTVGISQVSTHPSRICSSPMQPYTAIALPSFCACSVPEYTEALVYTLGECIPSLSSSFYRAYRSFVRSVSMDTWQEEQIRRMKARTRLSNCLQWYSHSCRL